MADFKKLGGGCVEPHDYICHRLAAKVPVGTTLEDILHPQYFQNYLPDFKWGTMISVVSANLELDVLVRVVETTQTTAKLRVLAVYNDPNDSKANAAVNKRAQDAQKKAGQAEDYTVKWGGAHKFRVMHGKDIIKTGYDSQEAAQEEADRLNAARKV